ncbi:MAG: chemotaxis protein CheX [Acetanaerobacterium sp.]
MTNALYLPFFNATRDVFSLMLDINSITEISGSADQVQDLNGKISIAIGVTGDLQGKILYRFPNETALEMVKIMSGMDFDAIDEFVTSAIGEIANIISGKALVILSQQKVTCDILPPKIVADEQGEQDELISSTSIATEIGTVGLDISLQAK